MSASTISQATNRFDAILHTAQIHLITARPAQVQPLVQHLHAAGATVQQHTTCAAFRTQPDSSADLLLLDAALPDATALSLCHDLRHNGHARPTLPVLMLGSSTAPDECVQAFAAGADDYIALPLEPLAVVARIAAHLHRSHQLAHLHDGFTFYRKLIDSAQNLVYILTPAGTLAYCSPASAKITGYTADELHQNPALLLEIVHPADRERVRPLHQVQQVGADVQLEYRINKPDGSIGWVLHSQQDFYAADGTWQGKRVSIRDISRRKQAEHELRQFQQAVEQSPVSIVLTDLQGTIQYVNPKFEQATGYTRSEALGNNPRVLKSGEMPSAGYRELWETIRAGKVWQGEFHNRRKDGELFWEWASISPIFDEQGTMTNYLAIKEDITERKQIEQALRQRNAELEELLKEVRAAIQSRDQLAEAIAVLEMPIIPILDHVLVVPLVGAIDHQRAENLIQRMLTSVAQRRARIIILDVTGLHDMHAVATQTLIEVVQAVRLLGARCILVGVTPAVAEAVVREGADLSRIEIRADLQCAVADVLHRA